MATKSILITQCVQNDFVKPLGKYEALPNTLHIGHEESERLMGIDANQGPLSKAIVWAYEQPESELDIIHIRDWHNPDDPKQMAHLVQFGDHCVQNTEGAEFAFPENLVTRSVKVVNASGLNDFVDTDLLEVLDVYKNESVNVGIVGVWTDAKVSFLAYELQTRYPRMRIGICSALTASSSRSHHFMAIEQLQRVLGIEIQSSIGEFTEYLSGKPINYQNLRAFDELPLIQSDGKANITPTDEKLIKYLYRDCKEVTLKTLDGGFSGNLVVGTESIDINGHEQVPHVVKIGEQEEIGKERSSFERIENVLGNSAPRITDFADLQGRGAIKYRYASMGGGFSNTFQKLYQSGTSIEKINSFLETIFVEQLGRLYRAATKERIDLLEYYWFSPSYAPRMKKKMEALLEREISDEHDHIEIIPGLNCDNMVNFYAKDIDKIKGLIPSSAYCSFVHGDLNGANIIVDAQENIWLIDFFHTHNGHVIKDLAKLENDMHFICTPVENEEDLRLACRFTDHIAKVQDLWNPLPEMPADLLEIPRFKRLYQVIGKLRSFYKDMIKTDRDPLQLLIAQLRYSAHAVGFYEPNVWQRKWALYASSVYAREIVRRASARGNLRIDWIEDLRTKGKLGLTILPGRKDTDRVQKEDIKSIVNDQVSGVVTLVTPEELDEYGVPDLLENYKEAGIDSFFSPILDQKTPSLEELNDMIDWLDSKLENGENVMIHCVGGLGRSGLLAACYLVRKGMAPEGAIASVRMARGARAVETKIQEDFVMNFS